MGKVKSVEERFWAKVRKTDTCWLWIAGVDKNGYGRMHYVTNSEYAHRISFWLHGGVIPEGKHLDHVCCVRNCVNPEHLRPLTRAQNSSRATKGKFKPLCHRGHDMNDPENVYWSTRRTGARAGEQLRVCAKCNRENAKRQYQKSQVC